MKGINHPRNSESLNPSDNESIRDVSDRLVEGRRHFLKSSLGAATLSALGGVTLGGFMRSVEAAPIPPSPGFAGIGFEGIAPNLFNASLGRLQNDLVSVPAGYRVEILSAWGDPIMPGASDWDPTATQDAAAQEKQVGMHHDGIHFFAFPTRGSGASAGLSNERGLLCMNHEYTHENILHGAEGLTGGVGVTIGKVRKSQAAHGVSVQEVRRTGQGWRVQRASPFGRRITANTLTRLSGPAAGNALMRAKKFQITPTASIDTGEVLDGRTAYGTLNNCAHGYTPWGTYLTCEENWNGYFAAPTNGAAIVSDRKAEILQGNARYGISNTGFGYQWHVADPRFNADTNPLEPNLFGWVVEIDPFDPTRVPVKRTAMGRFKHESAQDVIDGAGRIAFYMGDDEVNEYIYKFVCTGSFNPNNRAANRDLLDEGILYVAKFNADGTGTWIPLVFGQNGLTPANGFADQGEVLIKTRQAADRVGATMMDRPEWTAARPRVLGFQEIELYCTLTNNSRRGSKTASVNPVNGNGNASGARPPVDNANRRPDNIYGQIIRWREDGRSVAATTFTWDLFVECGDKLSTRTINAANFDTAIAGVAAPAPGDYYKGNINGDDYGAPDGLWFDYQGRLWIQTDQAGNGQAPFSNIGGNSMLCADPNTRETRRFLTSPPNCEVTGMVSTPDLRTMFVNIQHPGEGGTAANPTATSHWPFSQGYGPAGRPRSATVVITRLDGGVIGA